MKIYLAIPLVIATAFTGLGMPSSVRAELNRLILQPGETTVDTQEKADAEKADDEPKKETEEPKEDADIASITKEFDDAYKANYDAYLAETDRAKKTEIIAKFPKPPEFCKRIMKLANEDKESVETANGLIWILTKTGPARPNAPAGTIDYNSMAKEMLFKNFKESEAIANALPYLGRGLPTKTDLENIQALVKSTKHKRAKGVGMMSLFTAYESVKRYKGMVDDKRFAEFYGEETIQFIKDTEVPDMEELLETVANDYPDFDFGIAMNGRPVSKTGEMAANKLFSIRHLQVGKEAPEITAKDLDGIEFNLSDYRGKVVMLDFWGDW